VVLFKSANGGLNNKQITLRGMMVKEKKEFWNIKKINKKYELRPLPTCNTQLLKYNPMENNV
jgi:hypothetical protein